MCILVEFTDYSFSVFWFVHICIFVVVSTYVYLYYVSLLGCVLMFYLLLFVCILFIQMISSMVSLLLSSSQHCFMFSFFP